MKRFVKHPRFMDVCIEVYHMQNAKEGIRVLGRWWNMGINDSYIMSYKDNKEIPVNSIVKLEEWHYAESDGQKLRDAEWLEIEL